jgi:hypothetical protein
MIEVAFLVIALAVALVLWTAPTPTIRQLPSGVKLDDGFRSLIVCALYPAVAFWEKTVQPFGQDGMPQVDTTTMHNFTYRTFSPRFLKTLTEMKMKAAYDPAVLNNITALINVRTSWTIRFPDHSMWTFYGYLMKFEADALEEGKQPEANITIVPTNEDPTTHEEEGPVYSAPSGTGTYD